MVLVALQAAGKSDTRIMWIIDRPTEFEYIKLRNRFVFDRHRARGLVRPRPSYRRCHAGTRYDRAAHRVGGCAENCRGRIHAAPRTGGGRVCPVVLLANSWWHSKSSWWRESGRSWAKDGSAVVQFSGVSSDIHRQPRRPGSAGGTGNQRMPARTTIQTGYPHLMRVHQIIIRHGSDLEEGGR